MGKRTINFYMDDSGTRHPDHDLNLSARRDWFALGGVLVREEDEEPCRASHRDFCERWNINAPLHSEEIRGTKKNFRWLKEDPQRKYDFLTDLQGMLVALPVVGHACVIDRLGYHHRYHKKFGEKKWSLCRSSFVIAVDRAGKFAQNLDRRLNVFVEKSDRKTDNRIRSYFQELRTMGHPFDAKNAARYCPLSQRDLASTLYDFKIKQKSSPLMQIADLYLYPICRGGYSEPYSPFQVLVQKGRLIDAHVSDEHQRIKYYCFGRTELEALKRA